MKPFSTQLPRLLAALCLALLPLAAPGQPADQEPGPNLLAPPDLAPAGTGQGGLDLHGAGSLAPAEEAPAPAPAATPAPVPAPTPAPRLQPDSLVPPELDQPAGAAATPAPARPRVSAELDQAPVAVPPSMAPTEARLQQESRALRQDEQTNSAIVYLGMFVGALVLLLMVLILVLSQQNRRGSRGRRRKKRRRDTDLPLKQRMAIAPENVIREPAPAPDHPMAPPSRYGGGPRRVTSKNTSPATAATATGGRTSHLASSHTAKQEYASLFEHMLRMNRLREGEPAAILDRMTLAELHLHYNALLKIVPAEAREALVESIELLMDELEDDEPGNNPPPAQD